MPSKPMPNKPNKKLFTSSSTPVSFIVSATLRADWLRARQYWSSNKSGFEFFISSLPDARANALYDFAKLALFQDNVAQILRRYPALHGLISSDHDRLCMLDSYTLLSVKLNRLEKAPRDMRLIMNTRSSIGRGIPDFHSRLVS